MSIGLPCDRCGDTVINASSGWHPFLSKHGCADQPNQPWGWSAQEQADYHTTMMRLARTGLLGQPQTAEATAYLLREADLVLHSRSQAEWWQAVVEQRRTWPEWTAYFRELTGR